MSAARDRPASARLLLGAGLAGLIAVAIAARLALGLRTDLDADEATIAVAAMNVIHGGPHVYLTEPNLHYLGSVEIYVLVPFVAVLGPTLLAIRLAMAVVGAVFALLGVALGRALGLSTRRALLLGFVVALLPLFTTFWSIKSRGGYTEALPLAFAALTLAAVIGWRGRQRDLRLWALLGLVAGVGLWNELLSVIVLAVIAICLLLRAPALGWLAVVRGVLVALPAAALGFSPWLVYQLHHHFAGLNNLPTQPASAGARFTVLVKTQIPTLLGGSGLCGDTTVPAALSVGVLVALVLALLWRRRSGLLRILSGHVTAVAPEDMVLLVAPVTFAFVVLTQTTIIPCDPRYVFLAGPPIAVGAALLLMPSGPRSRARIGAAVAAVILVAWMGVSAATAARGRLPEQSSVTLTGGAVPGNLQPGVAMIEAHHPAAVWVQYWLAIPLLYYGDRRITVGVFGGPVAFPAEQAQAVAAAAEASWVFPANDPELKRFLNRCRALGVSYQEDAGGGLVLVTDLSTALTPAQAGV